MENLLLQFTIPLESKTAKVPFKQTNDIGCLFPCEWVGAETSQSKVSKAVLKKTKTNMQHLSSGVHL